MKNKSLKVITTVLIVFLFFSVVPTSADAAMLTVNICDGNSSALNYAYYVYNKSASGIPWWFQVGETYPHLFYFSRYSYKDTVCYCIDSCLSFKKIFI